MGLDQATNDQANQYLLCFFIGTSGNLTKLFQGNATLLTKVFEEFFFIIPITDQLSVGITALFDHIYNDLTCEQAFVLDPEIKPPIFVLI
jgi:hypothetical protein